VVQVEVLGEACQQCLPAFHLLYVAPKQVLLFLDLGGGRLGLTLGLEGLEHGPVLVHELVHDQRLLLLPVDHALRLDLLENRRTPAGDKALLVAFVVRSGGPPLVAARNRVPAARLLLHDRRRRQHRPRAQTYGAVGGAQRNVAQVLGPDGALLVLDLLQACVEHIPQLVVLDELVLDLLLVRGLAEKGKAAEVALQSGVEHDLAVVTEEDGVAADGERRLHVYLHLQLLRLVYLLEVLGCQHYRWLSFLLRFLEEEMLEQLFGRARLELQVLVVVDEAAEVRIRGVNRVLRHGQRLHGALVVERKLSVTLQRALELVFVEVERQLGELGVEVALVQPGLPERRQPFLLDDVPLDVAAPLVRLDLLHAPLAAQALLRVPLQQAGDEVDHDGVEVAGVGELGLQDALGHFAFVVGVEGRQARKHLVQQGAHRVVVYHVVVPFALQNLRTHILRRSAVRKTSLLRFENLGEAEISELDVAVDVDEDVFGLQVPVDDLLGVEVLDAQEDFSEVKLGQEFWKPAFLLEMVEHFPS